jgi:hypothetical protein
LHSLGLNYSGTEVNFGRDELELFRIDDIEMPMVGFTPSLVISSIIFYQVDTFPKWKDDIVRLAQFALYRYLQIAGHDFPVPPIPE